jgi:parvulin-like peptidyl-prolyl isomerase
LDRQAEVQAALTLGRVEPLATRNLARYRSRIEISDSELRAYYASESERTGGIEVHLKHILFADETAAMAASERAFGSPEQFDTLMQQYESGAALQSRDLGWANLAQLPPEVADAARQLPDGQVAPLPIQTRFGWHVIKRVGSRPFAAPPFEQVQEGARIQLVERALADQLTALRSGAAIERSAFAAQGN